MSGGSHASSHDQRVHFGLGDAAAVDGVEIRWPSGAVERITVPAVDRFYGIEEGQGIVPSVYDPRPQNRAKPAPPRAEGK